MITLEAWNFQTNRVRYDLPNRPWARRAEKGPWDTEVAAAGMHVTCARWFRQRDVAMVGSDTHGELMPSPVKGVPFPMHQLLLIAMAPDVAELTKIPRPPRGREEVPIQISRLLTAHEIILQESHAFARKADQKGDDGTNDLLVSDVIRTNELQVWFLAEHLVAVPLLHPEQAKAAAQR